MGLSAITDLQLWVDLPDHAQRQSVEELGSVQCYDSCTASPLQQHFRSFCVHGHPLSEQRITSGSFITRPQQNTHQVHTFQVITKEVAT